MVTSLKIKNAPENLQDLLRSLFIEIRLKIIKDQISVDEEAILNSDFELENTRIFGKSWRKYG